jgi:hypothetical protein
LIDFESAAARMRAVVRLGADNEIAVSRFTTCCPSRPSVVRLPLMLSISE